MPGLTLLKLPPDESMRDEYRLAPEKLVSGNPTQVAWNGYTDASGKFFTGIWQSEPGKWRISYTEEEYCHLLEGVSVITSLEGRSLTVRAGDRFVIPRGFTGTWEVIEATRKIYVIYEPGA